MPRAAKANKAKQPSAGERTPSRPKTAAPPAKATKPATAPKRAAAAPAAPVAAKVSKDELRGQVEKLERANATLRAKGREMNKAAKAATARIAELEEAAARVAELEEKVLQLERKASTPAVSPKSGAKRAKPADAKRRGRDIDPGDAVPPGVAVQEPEPLDDEAVTVLENLEEHLRPE